MIEMYLLFKHMGLSTQFTYSDLIKLSSPVATTQAHDKVFHFLSDVFHVVVITENREAIDHNGQLSSI